MKPINLDYLEKVQKYCDKSSHQAEFGYNETHAEWDETPLGRIGTQLDVISASIEEIFEIYNPIEIDGGQIR
jgi:hypothetical protein